MRTATAWCIAAAILGLIAPGPSGSQARAPNPPTEEGFLATPDGQRLYYRKIGDSPRIVIQPGRLLAYAEFEWLGNDFTLISYDMRNRGRSDLVADDAGISFEHDVADLETVRRHFGVERMALMGYSYLGKIVVLYALQHPARVERIVQFGAVGPDFGTEYKPEFVFRDDPVNPEARARLRAMRNEQNYHIMYPREYCREEWSVVHLPSLVGHPARADRVRIDVCDMPNEWPILQARHMRLHFEESGMTHQTPRNALPELRVPVLTVHGTRDRNAPYGAGREWAYLLPDARLLTVEGAGHHAFGERPELVMPAVERFLNGEWPEDAVRVTDDPRLD